MALPSVGHTGVFSVKEPFVLKDDVSYKCTGVFSFDAADKNNVDVLTTIFVANNLTNDDYLASKSAGSMVVTLEDGLGDIVTLPDDYILSLPSGESVPYSEHVITLTVGQLPDNVDLDTLLTDVVQRASGFTGVTCTGEVHKFVVNEHVSKEQHAEFEKAREAKLTYDKPDCGLLADSNATIAGLKQRVEQLEQIILDHVK